MIFRPVVAVAGAVTACAAFALAPTGAVAAPASATPTGAVPAAQAAADGLRGQEQARAASTGKALGLGSGESLTARSVLVDQFGVRHVRYERTLDGLRVVGGDLVAALTSAGEVTSVHYNRGKDLAVARRSADVSPGAARATAAAATGQRGQSATELVVYAVEGTPRLAWEVRSDGIQADQTPSRRVTYVDAATGALIESIEEIVTGTGNSQYSGTVSLATISSGGVFQLKDAHGNYATDLNGATSGTGTLFTDADDVWGNGSITSRQTAGVDAEYGAEQTYAFYAAVLGRAGIWNNGTGARSRVHYGNGYNNAFWDGTQMTYGDGTGNAKPLTSIDVAGHEMSHGVTSNTANLAYRKESGGLNEATSDIFGTAVEFYASNSADVGDYFIGERIDLRGNGTPLRYMDQPSKDGSSPNCYSSTVGRLDVHYSSGPLNHWYFLASEGSGSRTVNGVAYNSPTCNGVAVTGAGRDAATKIWYRTLTTKLTSSSGYAAARQGAILSAKELYGKNSAQCLATESAFNAISVPKGTQTCAN